MGSSSTQVRRGNGKGKADTTSPYATALAAATGMLLRAVGFFGTRPERCFREYFDISVTDYLKTVRLDAAYRELKAANGEGNTVTRVALQNGFTHLGRFSVAYHVRFGEMPSETLAAMPGAN